MHCGALIECLMMLFCDRLELHVCWAAYQLHLHLLRQTHVKRKKKVTFLRELEATKGEIYFFGGEKNLFRDKLTLGVISLLEK